MQSTSAPAVAIRLTKAQRSAIECAGLDVEDIEPDQNLDALRAAWDGGIVLQFAASDRNAIFSALCEASNAEDFVAEYRNDFDLIQRQQARGASVALSNLSSKVLRAVAV